jgi:protein-S-isoprenylcysteine O-methyltransferase Ste14
MKINDTTRHIAGYILGFSLFAVLIPYGLVNLCNSDHILSSLWPVHIALRLFISIPFFLTGLVFAIWSNVFLLAVGKGGPADGFNVAISPRTKKLVVTGPYLYCRNPMVFEAFMVYFSIGFFKLSLICSITLLVFVGLVTWYLKSTEEKRLEKDFGSEYLEYKARVPMIFPWKGRLK